MPQPLFEPSMLRGRAVHIVGVGSLGGAIAENLFKKKVPELHLWDFDIVEARNRYNQRVFAEDVGLPKVEVRARILRAIYPESDTKLVLHRERVVAGTPLSGIVISAVDWNRIRYQEVWPCVRGNLAVTFFTDGRVGMDGGKAYGLDPNNPWHWDMYEDPSHKHPDPVGAEENAVCKSEFPMPENADMVAAEVLWRLTRWLHLEGGSEDPYDNFVGWQFVPQRATVTEQWDDDMMCVMERRRYVAPSSD